MDRRSPPSPFLLRTPTRRNLRWASGLVLMAYITAHLLNHSLGVVSFAAAETVLRGVQKFWHSLPGTLLLYGAALTHLVLAVAALWERRTLRMPPLEALRVLLGFALPLLLATHLTAMRGAWLAYGIEGSYVRVVWGLWDLAGAGAQLGMMLAAWAHGCLGLHFALRVRPLYRRLFAPLLAVAVLLPVTAAMGFVSMGREFQWTGVPPVVLPTPEQGRALNAAETNIKLYYALALLALLAAYAARSRLARRARGATVALRYPDRTVHVPPGWSVLEASRSHGIAHVSICGGRARCSTCRVRVGGAPEHIGTPGRDEQRTLERVRAPHDVRLACQLRPRGSIEVTPLFAPLPREGRPAPVGRFGHERDVAILFVDLRRWSGLSERQWPFDLAYVLDRYFAIVGAAVRESGGVPNQFIGDSVMAIFGLESDLPTACRQALHATQLIGERMDAWNVDFQAQFGQQLDFGMGLHAGRAAVGEVGYLETTTFTAIGEVVNTASRLQDHSKAASARLVVSQFAAQQAGAEATLGPVDTLNVRGRSEPLAVMYSRVAKAG
ncbi:adenylate/guanylate cyclase domain-containing protein [Variovorax boronicumulans]|uniref:Adenylate/guanylate cyclase domain-containing protein n=1 Tax=Variovorax boronicumulans TaxID=436515 RepID=A0A250DU81_9BURK|nr:adenylate/guanylate cyclase domain-containing protein [Variovorax boronicumulans]ATA57938.1 adenylate/guanylate cyclase domain-containing protein [Variovorax boronicumulans]